MSLLYKDIFGYLVSRPEVNVFVGTRVFGLQIPQWSAAMQETYGGPLPAIVYRESLVEHHEHLEGGSASAETDLTIECLASTYVEVKGLADAVRRVLDTYLGSMGETDILGSICDGEQDIYDNPVDGSDNGSYRVMMSFNIVHSESLPIVQGE